MTSAELNLLLDEAFQLWLDTVGLDLEAKSFTISLGGGRDTYSLRKQAQDLQEARELDSTGLTCFMLMQAFVEAFIEQETITALQLIKGLTDEEQARLAVLRKMREFLDRPVIQEYVDDFTQTVWAATDHYGIEHKDLESWIMNPYWMAILRRDALRSMEGLQANQFCWGEGTEGTVQYGTKVMEFWNMPSLVRAMQVQGLHGIPGVNLCLIRDPEGAEHSFFVISVVNGESITVLTDRKRGPHPDYKRMSRKPDRDLVRRAHQHWFPYGLLDLKVTEDGKRLYEEARTGLVPLNAQAVALEDFSKLHPATAIWLSLLFDLIRDAYFVENSRLPELSYTTEMVRVPELIASQSSSLVRQGLYTPLEAPPLTHEDISTERLAEEQGWGNPLVGHNQWMLDRYGPLVPAEVFNLIGREERLALRGAASVALLAGKGGTEDGFAYDPFFRGSRDPEDRPYPAGVTTDVDRIVFDIELSASDVGAVVQGSPLRTLDPVDFGTGGEIERDRKWTARMNHCRVIQKLAEKEFRATSETVFRTRRRRDEPPPSGWYVRKVQARKNWLIEMAVRGEWDIDRVPDQWYEQARWKDGEKPKVQKVNLVKTDQGRNWPGSYRSVRNIGFADHYLSKWTGNSAQVYCAVTGAVASYHATINPQTPEHLAEICGCKVEDLPWQLQHWCERNPSYHGNPILDRCDPAEWTLHNPWSSCNEARTGGFGLSLGVSLSKRAVNAMRKKLGMPKMEWKI